MLVYRGACVMSRPSSSMRDPRSLAPSLPPSLLPSLLPSLAPSLPPSLPPSLTPSLPPSLPPSPSRPSAIPCCSCCCRCCCHRVCMREKERDRGREREKSARPLYLRLAPNPQACPRRLDSNLLVSINRQPEPVSIANNLSACPMPRAWQVLTELLLLLPTPSFVEAPVATSHPPLVLASPSVFVAVARARFLARGSVRMYMRASFVRASVRACIPPSLRLFLSHPFFHTPPAPATRLLLQPHASCSSHTSPAPATHLLLQQHVTVSCSSQSAACVRASFVYSCVRVCACVRAYLHSPRCACISICLCCCLSRSLSRSR